MFGDRLERGREGHGFERRRVLLGVLLGVLPPATQLERRVRRARRVRGGDATGFRHVQRRVQRRAQERAVRHRRAERLDRLELAARVAEVAQTETRVRVGKVVVLAGARGRVRGRARERREDPRARRRVPRARERRGCFFFFFRRRRVEDARLDILSPGSNFRRRFHGSLVFLARLRARRAGAASAEQLVAPALERANLQPAHLLEHQRDHLRVHDRVHLEVQVERHGGLVRRAPGLEPPRAHQPLE